MTGFSLTHYQHGIEDVKTAVMISGRGSNMAALLDYATQPETRPEIVLVVADGPAPGLDIAARHGIKTLALPRPDFASRRDHEAAIKDALTTDALTKGGVELICLAGYMRLLSADFCRDFEGRMINIHPSLLPLHKGLDTHQKAIDAGDAVHGCSVHFVTAGMDDGPVIAQRQLAVHADDTADSLAGRVLRLEHQLYPLVLGAMAEGLITLKGETIEHRSGPLPGVITDLTSPLTWQA